MRGGNGCQQGGKGCRHGEEVGSTTEGRGAIRTERGATRGITWSHDGTNLPDALLWTHVSFFSPPDAGAIRCIGIHEAVSL